MKDLTQSNVLEAQPSKGNWLAGQGSWGIEVFAFKGSQLAFLILQSFCGRVNESECMPSHFVDVRMMVEGALGP